MRCSTAWDVLLLLVCRLPYGIYLAVVSLKERSKPARSALGRLAFRLRSIPSIFRLLARSNLCYHCRSIRLSTLRRGLQHHSSLTEIQDCGKKCPLCGLFCRVMEEGPDTTLVGFMQLQIDQEIGFGDMATLAIGTMTGQLQISCKAGTMPQQTLLYELRSDLSR